jgi:hypothetical protein
MYVILSKIKFILGNNSPPQLCINLFAAQDTHSRKGKKRLKKGKNRTKKVKKRTKKAKGGDKMMSNIKYILGKKSPPQYCVCSYMLLKDTHSRW